VRSVPPEMGQVCMTCLRKLQHRADMAKQVAQAETVQRTVKARIVGRRNRPNLIMTAEAGE